MGGRCSAATGPTSAPRPPPQQAAEDIERYGTQQPTRPLDEVLADLWAAWTRQADLHDQHQRLAGERDALQQVAAIQARYTPTASDSATTEIDARRRWLQARQRVDDLDAALKSETADLQTRVWAAWRQELSQAQRAAEVVRDGAGRLGQHRRQVRDASAELTAFAERWRPAVPDLPTDPAELADQVMWLHGRRVEDPINAYVARAGRRRPPGRGPDPRGRARRLHRVRPRRTGAHASSTRPSTPSCARTAGQRTPATPPADSPPSPTNWQVSNATCAPPRARVDALTARAGDPDASRAEDSTASTQRWAADRLARQEAAAREAKERRQRQQETRRIEPPPPSRSTPDHGRGIGR